MGKQYTWKDLYDAVRVKTSLENSQNHLKAKEVAQYFLEHPEEAHQGDYASKSVDEIKDMCKLIIYNCW